MEIKQLIYRILMVICNPVIGVVFRVHLRTPQYKAFHISGYGKGNRKIE
jgi:hypothetical protein